MKSFYPPGFNRSLFDEPDTNVVANRVYQLMKEPLNWSVAHHDPNYLDMIKVRYRTFQLEYFTSQETVNLPSLFAREFGSQMHKYNILVDRYGNRFEVVLEKHNGVLCFTHGWSQISDCYVDNDDRGGWASLTYIRPRLFVFVLKNRYYEYFIGRHIYNPAYFNLSRELFGPDKFLESVTKIALPYRHDDKNFAHIFIVTLAPSDVTSGFLTIEYDNFASKLFAKNARFVKLIDEKGLEWDCTVQYIPTPSGHVKIGGGWGVFLRARNLVQGATVLFGTNTLGKVSKLFVKKGH